MFSGLRLDEMLLDRICITMSFCFHWAHLKWSPWKCVYVCVYVCVCSSAQIISAVWECIYKGEGIITHLNSLSIGLLCFFSYEAHFYKMSFLKSIFTGLFQLTTSKSAKHQISILELSFLIMWHWYAIVLYSWSNKCSLAQHKKQKLIFFLLTPELWNSSMYYITSFHKKYDHLTIS